MDGTLQVWNLESGECLRVLKGNIESVKAIAVTPDGQNVVSQGWDNTLRFWNLESGDCLAKIYRLGLNSMTLCPKIGNLVAGFSDGRVEFYKIHNIPLDPFITTVNREIISEDLPAGPITARPACCGQLVNIPETVSERIDHWLLHGGDGGYNDPALLIDCPSCGEPLRMNPFFVDTIVPTPS
jgi:WD40 repeat protein